MTLSDCLKATSWRNLYAMARYHRLPVRGATSKADLVKQLFTYLSVSARASTLISGLDGPTDAAFQAVLRAGGSMPVSMFSAAHGPLRLAHGQGGDPRHLIGRELSAAETLILAGLVFDVGPDHRPATRRVVIPEEWLPPPPSEHRLDPAGQSVTTPGRGVEAPVALALVLGYLNAERPSLLKGGRLSPRHIRRLNIGLGFTPAQSADLALSPGLFFYDLAEHLNLITSLGGIASPSPWAATWLAQSALDQWRDIWQCLVMPPNPSPGRWRVFHPLGLPEPHPFFHRLLVSLTSTPTSSRLDLHRLHLDDLLPWWEQEAQPNRARRIIRALLSGPLNWLGLVTATSDEPDVWQLTARTLWLLGHTPPPTTPSINPLQLTPELTLTLPPTPSLPAILALGPWIELKPTATHDPFPVCLALTQHSIRRAVQTGATLTDLLDLLTRHVPHALTPAQVFRLSEWLPTPPSLTLRPAWLLTATTPTELTALLAHPLLRPHHSHRLTSLIAELILTGDVSLAHLAQRLGLTPPSTLFTPPHTTTEASLETPIALGWLLVALETLTHLAQRLHQPTPPPGLAARLAEQAGPSLAADARLVADQLRRRLDETLTDDPPILPPRVSGFLDQIQTALENHTPIRLTYWTLGRPRPLTRHVHPLRLEWRGDIPYLIAHCDTREAERVFRLDRILMIKD